MLTLEEAREELTVLRGKCLLDKLRLNTYHDDVSMEVKTLHCLRCGCEWLPRIPGKPVRCPRCGSFVWDKPKAPKP